MERFYKNIVATPERLRGTIKVMVKEICAELMPRKEEIYFLTIDEAAQRLRISRGTLYNRIYDGSIPSYTIGRRRLIKVQDIDEYLNSQHDDDYDY